MDRMTPEQERATDPAASVWVGASAGTGKTHVLTARVLRMMLTGTEPGRILCLTFTKAAAAEMANRIHEVLAEWVRLGDEKLANSIRARTGEKADGGMLERARQLFGHVLDLHAGLQIQTIHAFCQSLLGRFPLEAGLNPHFEAMDEGAAKEYLQTAMETLLAEAMTGKNAALQQAVGHVATRLTEQSFQDLMQAVIRERGLIQKLRTRYRTAEGIVKAVRGALDIAPDETVETVIAAACRDEVLDLPGLRDLASGLQTGTATERQGGEMIAGFLEQEESRPAQLPDYAGVFLTGDGVPRKRVANKATWAANPRRLDVIAAESARLSVLKDRCALVRLADNTAAMLHIATAMLQTYDDEKKRRGLLDYDDLILQAEKLLASPGMAPWILYKLDGGIDHILIDEAQDTNPEQWRVIETLSAEFFAGQSAREQVRTLFAVGDVKQSIFGFQRAAPELFSIARKRVEARSKAAELGFSNVALNVSFRSTLAVLKTVDEVFAEPSARVGLTADEEQIIHETQRVGQAGLVELWEPETGANKTEAEDWEPPVRQEGADDTEARLARKIGKKIGDMLEAKELLEARGRPVRPGDIMVLVRRRTPFVDHLVRVLKTSNIPVAGADRMVLTDQLPVMDLMALADFALLPDDDLTLATVLKSPFIGFREKTLFDLAYDRKDRSLWRSLVGRADERVEFRAASDFLGRLLGEADFTAPFEFFSHILTRDGGRHRLLARLGGEAIDPINEFLSLALEYERSHLPSLQGFLSWLRASGAEIKREMDTSRNEVRILTVHAAKGLQAPVVFLPDTCQKPRADEKLLKLPAGQENEAPLLVWPGNKENEAGAAGNARERLKQKTDAEYRRLLYVALTRAEDRLYITGWETSHGRAEGSWHDLVEKAFVRLPGVEETEESADGLIRRYRCPQTAVIRREEIKARPPASDILTPGWLRKKAPADPAPPKPLAPSRPDEEEVGLSPLKGLEGDRFRRGLVIHKLLEILPDIAMERREQAAIRYLRQSALDLDGEAARAHWREISAILTDPDFAAIFGPDSRAEVSITGLLGGQVVAGQVDRLVVTDHNVLIVDYKTARAVPQTAAEVPLLYLKQMAGYARVLQKIYPERAVRAALLWTGEARLMPLDPAVLDTIPL